MQIAALSRSIATMSRLHLTFACCRYDRMEAIRRRLAKFRGLYLTGIAYHGVGEALEVDNLSVDALHALIQRVLNTPSYGQKAQYFEKIIGRRRGLDLAAEAIERAFEAALANPALELSPS